MRNAWPNVFRVARSVPGVEYLRAQRLRSLAMVALDGALEDVDAIVHGPYSAGVLQLTTTATRPSPRPSSPKPAPSGRVPVHRVLHRSPRLRRGAPLHRAALAERPPRHVRRPSLDWLAPRALEIPASAAPMEILKVAFMEGRWVAVNRNSVNEEVWSPPRGDALVGTFRQVRRDSDTALVEVSRSGWRTGRWSSGCGMHGRLEVPESRAAVSVFELVSTGRAAWSSAVPPRRWG